MSEVKDFTLTPKSEIVMVFNTTPDGVWTPLVGFNSKDEAKSFIGGFADVKKEAAKQGVLNGQGSASIFGRAVALNSKFAIVKLQADEIVPEEVVRIVRP